MNPPEEVQASFNEVNQGAAGPRERDQYCEWRLQRGGAESERQADQTIRGAEGYRFKRVNEAEGDVASFNAMLEQYIKAPEITRTRLYLETMGGCAAAWGKRSSSTIR